MRTFGAATLLVFGFAVAAGCSRLSGLDDLHVVDCLGCPGPVDPAGEDLDGSTTPGPRGGSTAGGTTAGSGSTSGSTTSGSSTPDASGPDASDASDADADASAPPDTGTPPPSCVGTGKGGPTLVQVGSYCIDSSEVTIGQYDAFLASHGAPLVMSELPSACSAKSKNHTPDNWSQQKSKGTNLPVAYVDWCDAYAFCKWAGKRLCGAIGGGPTQAAWAGDATKDQYFAACSKGGTRPYPYGASRIEGACNEKAGGITGGVVTVKSLSTCEGGYTGLYDMTGNVYEWVDACVGSSLSDGCLIRGGSFRFGGATYASCAAYFNDYPVLRSDRYDDMGFRCCSQ